MHLQTQLRCFRRKQDYATTESRKSRRNIPVNIKWSKWFVIGVFMAQSDAAKSAAAD